MRNTSAGKMIAGSADLDADLWGECAAQVLLTTILAI